MREPEILSRRALAALPIAALAGASAAAALPQPADAGAADAALLDLSRWHAAWAALHAHDLLVEGLAADDIAAHQAQDVIADRLFTTSSGSSTTS